jgi:hypothetical protein
MSPQEGICRTDDRHHSTRNLLAGCVSVRAKKEKGKIRNILVVRKNGSFVQIIKHWKREETGWEDGKRGEDNDGQHLG